MVPSRSTLAVNCAKPGAVLAHMTDTSTARVFLNLPSGGGNDLIDAANTSPNAAVDQRLLLTPGEWGTGGSASRYLSDAGWTTFANHMSEVVDLLLAQHDKKPLNRDIPVFFDTYDYVTPRNSPAGPGKGPWLFKAVKAFGIPPGDWNAVSDELMNRHATMWLALEPKLSNRNVHVVDSRGATTRAAAGTTDESNDWENEIHPTPAGYSLLARKWRAQLDTLT